MKNLNQLIESVVRFLRETQHNDGGWGYTTENRQSFLEPTSWTLRALAGNSSASETINRGIKFIKISQNEDRGWSNLPGLPSDITTSHVILALSTLGLEENLANEGIRWLLLHEVRKSGWGWCKGSDGFAEPLSYSILALASTNCLSENERLIDLLLSYQCHDNGWNCHVPNIHEKFLESQPALTAISVIALFNSKINLQNDILDRVVKRLEEDVRNGNVSTTYTRALVLLAFCKAGRSSSAVSNNLRQALFSSADSNGSWQNNILWTAMGCVALDQFMMG